MSDLNMSMDPSTPSIGAGRHTLTEVIGSELAIRRCWHAKNDGNARTDLTDHGSSTQGTPDQSFPTSLLLENDNTPRRSEVQGNMPPPQSADTSGHKRKASMDLEGVLKYAKTSSVRSPFSTVGRFDPHDFWGILRFRFCFLLWTGDFFHLL